MQMDDKNHLKNQLSESIIMTCPGNVTDNDTDTGTDIVAENDPVEVINDAVNQQSSQSKEKKSYEKECN